MNMIHHVGFRVGVGLGFRKHPSFTLTLVGIIYLYNLFNFVVVIERETYSWWIHTHIW